MVEDGELTERVVARPALPQRVDRSPGQHFDQRGERRLGQVQPVPVGAVRPGVPIEHHDVDALPPERVRQRQPADAGADDPHP